VANTEVAVSRANKQVGKLAKCYKQLGKRACWRETKQHPQRISHDPMAMQPYAQNTSNRYPWSYPKLEGYIDEVSISALQDWR
jgi:hypothetical protein